MAYRISPAWWPALALTSPISAPLLFVKNRRYGRNRDRAESLNRERLRNAEPLDLPELEFLELTVLVEAAALEGYEEDSGVSYLIRTDRGVVLFDVGFGPATGVLTHNLEKLGLTLDDVDAVVISHLHLDHMGGMKAMRANRVAMIHDRRPAEGRPCYVPDHASAEGLEAELVLGPRLLEAGLGTTGPLVRSLFFQGLTEEQSLVARVRDKGTFVITGCGHPTIALTLRMTDRLSNAPLYGLAGGFHLPIKQGRLRSAGIDIQTVFSTGKPPWRRVDDRDLEEARDALNSRGAKRVLVSAHDSCDYAIGRLEQEIDADVDVLKAGATYRI